MTKEEVIEQLLFIAKQTGHTPSSKLVPDRLVSAALRFFETWNKAMESVGLPPTIDHLHRKRICCSDGHRADSISERVIDDWLYRQGVLHERSKLYPGELKLNCDFYLPDHNVWMEYFGLWGRYP
ncbi:MAG: hypothetical protein WC824_15200, partial [Bacteroidota bacterium]